MSRAMIRTVIPIFGLGLVLILSSCGGSPTPKGADLDPGETELNTLTNISVNELDASTLIEISAEKDLTPNVFKLTDPLRVIIDFTDTKLGEIQTPLAVNNGIINEISVDQFDDVSSSLSRVVIGFDALVDYEVSPESNVLTVSVPKEGAVAADAELAVEEFAETDELIAEPAAETAEIDIIDVLDDIPVEETPTPSVPATMLADITLSTSGGETVISLQGDGNFENIDDFILDDPERLVIDLKGVKSNVGAKSRIAVDEGLVASVRTGSHTDKARVVVDFTPGSSPNYRLDRRNDGLDIVVSASLLDTEPFAETTSPSITEEPAETIVDISELPLAQLPVEDPFAAEVAVAAEAEPFAEIPQAPIATTPSYQIDSVDFVQTQASSRLVVKTTAPASYSTYDEGSDTVVLTLNGATISQAASRFLDTSAFNSAVSLVVPKQVGKDTRIVTTLKETVPYKVTQDGNLLYLDFERSKDFATDLAPAVTDATTPSEEPAAIAEAVPAEAPPAPAEKTETADEIIIEDEAELFEPVATKEDDDTRYEYVKEELLSETLSRTGESQEFNDDMIFEAGSAPSSKYTGRKINLDFKDADIRSLFRLFADISKLNIIVGDDVKGKVTIRLRDVPWDQAFAILLQTRGLGAIKYGNIIRIAPAGKIQKERELFAQAKKAAIAAAPLDTLFKAVSYATAAEIAAHVRTVLSERGSVDIDNRTNTLIIRDVREKLVEAKTLIDKLDAQTPQVSIEARIVEANDTFVRNWGVQWGATADFSAATGNPTGILFPNSIGATGSVLPTPPLGGTNPVLLNFPPTGANSSVTLNLGSINNVLDLDLLLGYEESEGNAKLISSPKVTVLDNRPATILSGTKIPFLTQTANAGSNVRFESAVISITVTPHITADGSVIMNITATRNEPDFGQQVLGNPTIIQREATTEVLVKSGNTTVIGGIYRINRTRNTSGFPFLRKVPILGWFFRSDNRRLERQELLIFVTPRIVGDERTVIRQVQG